MIHPVIQRAIEYKLGHVKLTKAEELLLAVDFYNHRIKPTVPWSFNVDDPLSAAPIQKILNAAIEELLARLDKEGEGGF